MSLSFNVHSQKQQRVRMPDCELGTPGFELLSSFAPCDIFAAQSAAKNSNTHPRGSLRLLLFSAVKKPDRPKSHLQGDRGNTIFVLWKSSMPRI